MAYSVTGARYARGEGSLDARNQQIFGLPLKSILKKPRADWTPPGSKKTVDPCHRCQGRVYPVDRINIEFRLCYHKECFTCSTCDRKLSLKDFHLSSGKDREIYCFRHVPSGLSNCRSISPVGRRLHRSASCPGPDRPEGFRERKEKKKHRTSFNEEVRYSYIDQDSDYDPDTLDERLSDSNAREVGLNDIDESKRNSLGRKRKSWMNEHENEATTEPPLEEVMEPDPNPVMVIAPSPVIELKSAPDVHLESGPDLQAAMTDDESSSKEDLAAIEDDDEGVTEQQDIMYEAFVGAYGDNLQRMDESFEREKEGLLDELTGGISSSGRPRSGVDPSTGDNPHTDMSPVAGHLNDTDNQHRQFYDPSKDLYDPNESFRERPRHDGPGISPDAILASMIMERLSGQPPVRTRVGRRLEDDENMGSKEYIPTLPYKTIRHHSGLPPDGPPHYTPRGSGRGRGRGEPYGPYHYGPYSRPGEYPTPAPRPQQKPPPPPKINAGPIIHGARPGGLERPKTPEAEPEPEREPGMIPDPVLNAVETAIEKRDANKNVPEEYTGYYIETCVGVDENFYNSPLAKRGMHPSRREYTIDELALRAKYGLRSPETRSKSLDRGLEEVRPEEYAYQSQGMVEGPSTLERGRERERVNRARKHMIMDEGSQGSLDGSKERVKPTIATKPKISDKLKQEFRSASHGRVNTPTASDKLREEFIQRAGTPTGSTERGASMEKKETKTGKIEMTDNSSSPNVKIGTVQKTVIRTHQQPNQSSGIEVVELSDTSSTGSSRPGSRPGSAGATRPQNLGGQDFMYNAMLQQSITTAVSRHGASRSVPRDQTSSMDRSMTRDPPTTANKMKRSQTSSMDRSTARRDFFEPKSEHNQGNEVSLKHGKDEKKREKGASDRSSSYSSLGSDKDSPRTRVTAEGQVETSATPGGPVVSGSTPAARSGSVQPGSVKITGGPVISGLMPETAMQGSVERDEEKKRDGRVATPLIITKTPEPGKGRKGAGERGQDLTKSGGVVTPPISAKTTELHTARDGTKDRHFKKKTETSMAYEERVQKSESTPSFRETTQDATDSFRTPNRGFEYDYEMDVSTTSNDVRPGSHKTTRIKSSGHLRDGETPKSSSKDRRRKDSSKNRKEIQRDESFDSQLSVTLHTDNSDTTYGQDSMTQAAVRGAVRDTVHDNMFGQETTLSPVTPGTNWAMMEDRFSTPKGKKDKDKKSKGGFFSLGSKRKPKRSRENSLDSTLDTTMDSTFDKKSLASMGSQDTLNETVKRSDRRTEKGKERERVKDRTVKVKDKNKRGKGKEALKEVTNQDMDSISDMYIEGDDDLLKKEDMERIGSVPMKMTSTPDGQRKVMKKPNSERKFEIVDTHDGRGRDGSRRRDENRETEYTTTKDVMNAMFVGSMERKKRSPRKKSRERKDRKEEEERLQVTELSIDEMLKEREISKEDRQRVKETSSTRAVKENSVDRRHSDKEHTSSRTHKEHTSSRTHKGGEGRHRTRSDTTGSEKESDEKHRTKANISKTRKDSEEEGQLVKKHTSKSEKSDRYIKKKKEPSDATRAIMSELLLQVGASPSRKHREGEGHDSGEDEEVVYRKVVKRRAGQSAERRRHVKRTEERTEEFEYRNGEAAAQEGKRREGRNEHLQNGRDSSYEEYKVEWNEYPEDEFENTSYSGFDVSLDEVIQEREYRKSEVFKMLLEDTAFEKKLRRLAEKRAREMEKAGDTGSEGTGSTPRSSVRSSDKSTESLDEMDLLRELEKRIEEYFEKQKQKKIKALMKKFMAEEGTRMSMLMSHEDEVLDLIALKDREMYGEILEPTLPPAPEAEPPEYSRSVLYVSADVFEELDTEVIEIAQHEQASYIELVRDLTRRCKTELDRVRAIFRWITVKDLSKIRFEADERINPESLLGMLKGIKEGKASYHDLFKRLCGYAGIHCTVIQGYSKGAGYRPGMKVEHKAFRNTWTAVNVNKSWRFVNCNWGARHYKNTSPIKQEPAGKDLCYKCDEFYFLTDPEDHIFQHFPDDKKWQLLRRPITMIEFMKLPVLKSPFFNAGLMKPTHKLEDRIYTQDGRIEIAFKMRKFPGLHCTLELIEGRTVIPEPEGHSLIRIIDEEVIFLVTPPDIGRYFFNVYVAENWKSNSLEHAAAFLIFAGDDCFDNGSNGVFPSTGVIGKTPVMKKLGIDIPPVQDPYIMISCNTWTEVTLPFTLKRDVKLSHQMKLFNRKGMYVGDYDEFVFLKYKGSKSYCVRCPREGVYALSVFAGDAKDRSPKLECIFKYLIDCESAQMTAPPFPKPSRRWIGCVLHEPISGELDVNTKYTFGLEIPDAVEVSVVIGDKWQALEFSEDSEDLWEGLVHTRSKPGVTATVFVRYDEDSDKFSPLLDYTVVGNKGATPGKL
ncbi:uncharacterized protein LOC135496179 isoform X2 [Lineus longissimus]|uniref:uncharacterized protein LOC135496179 isoform X2 n=1 Tax=Lineus longissimus TaxID=88925 RepID=UPI00315D0747